MSVKDDEHEIDEHNLLILYATETGYALDIAEQIARELQRRGFAYRLLSTDSYPAVCLTFRINLIKLNGYDRKTL